MAATFVVEDGSGLSNSNALVSVSDADQVIENYGNSSDWSGATEANKQTAIRQATRYLNYNYVWDGYKSVSTQACQWPRADMLDEDYNEIDSDVVPDRVKEACAYLALKVIEGETLFLDFDDESKIKRKKDIIGPITEEREFLIGESPAKTYTTADKLVAPFITSDTFGSTELYRG